MYSVWLNSPNLRVWGVGNQSGNCELYVIFDDKYSCVAFEFM